MARIPHATGQTLARKWGLPEAFSSSPSFRLYRSGSRQCLQTMGRDSAPTYAAFLLRFMLRVFARRL